MFIPLSQHLQCFIRTPRVTNWCRMACPSTVEKHVPRGGVHMSPLQPPGEGWSSHRPQVGCMLKMERICLPHSHRCAWINPKKNRLNMLKLIPFLTMFILSERSCPKWYWLALLLSHFHAKKQRPGHRWKRLPQIVRIGIPRFMRTTEWNTSAFESLDVAPGTPFPMLCHATLLFPSCWRSWRPSLNMTIRYYKYGCIHCGISMNIPITFPWYPKLWPWHTGDSKALKSDGATLAWGPVGSETGLWERERVAVAKWCKHDIRWYYIYIYI